MNENERLVTLAVFETEFEASLARGALEAIGIAAHVPAELRGGFGSYSGGLSVGNVELKVFESDRDRALSELRRMQMHVVRPGESDA